MKLLLTLLLILLPTQAFAQWQQLTETHCIDDNNVIPAIENNYGYINTHTGYGPYINTWMEVDTTIYGVPADAKAVFLIGRLIITGGSASQSPNMTVLFAKPSSTISQSVYQIQATGKGVRQPFSTWVPLENGKYKFLWNTPGNPDPWQNRWPTYAAYGLNTTIQCWAR